MARKMQGTWNRRGMKQFWRESYPFLPCASNMEWSRSENDLFVRLDPDEEIHASLRSLADEIGFDAAAITSGIGRTRNNVYGFMDDDGVYHKMNQSAACELVSLQGNLARLEDGSAFTHIHVTLSDDDMVVRAGHLFEAAVHVVAEIHLRILEHATMMRCPVADSEFIALKFS